MTTDNIPDKGENLVRYYGWYSHRQRGLRAKSQSAAVSDSDLHADEITIDRSVVNAQKSAADAPRPGSLSTWAMLIQRVYEVDPLACPHCGAAMKIVSFIECRQRDVIERILRHCGLWEVDVLQAGMNVSCGKNKGVTAFRILGKTWLTPAETPV